MSRHELQTLVAYGCHLWSECRQDWARWLGMNNGEMLLLGAVASLA